MERDTPFHRAGTGLTVTLMALAVFGAVAGIDFYGFFWATVAALSFSWIALYLLAFVYIRQRQRMEQDTRGQEPTTDA